MAIATRPASAPRLTRRFRRRPGDIALEAITGLAALASAVLVGLIAWQVFDKAWPAIDEFGLGFITSQTWDPGQGQVFGAATFIFGTALTSLVALALAAPLAIAIALYLTELAPRFLRGPVTALVETLAAVPSVVLGLWGILVLGPQVVKVEPWLHDHFGFIPLFGKPSQSGTGILPAVLILTIMMLPIISSITRELFLSVPRELKDGALALGLTRWEMIRGVVFPYARAGMAAAMILGVGRAIGEAIAVTQVIGGAVTIDWSLFSNGDTLASRIAAQYQGATTNLQIASIVYLAAILLFFSLIVNLLAQWVVRRVARRHAGGVVVL
jgi:phosphate transport system permease protein